MKPAKLLVAAALVCCLVMSATAAHAWRQPVLNLGLTNVNDGAAPPPGLYLSMYTLISTAPSANVKDAALNGLFPDLKNLDSTTTAIAPQIVWVSPWKCPVTGANFGFDFFPILGSISADLDGTGLPAGAVNNSPVGDMIFGPFLAFHRPLPGFGSLHWVLEFDTFAPVGQYDSSKILQFAQNHWTIEPWLSFTLLGPYGTELSSRLHYTYNFTNDDFDGAEMKPGQAFHMNYALTKEVCTPRLRMGVVGYYLQQLNEDKINGAKIIDSEEMAVAVGPVVWYNKGDFIIEAKTHFDVEVENRPKAITGVLRVIYNFF
jgi:anthranilate 1,2-dioxygenase (deaminating, decarboxylating) large subunit